MTYRIRLSDRAIDDLIALQGWVAGQADRETALAYTARIEAKFATLRHFPNRGTPRDDLVPGLRTINFERKIIIGYRVLGSEVLIEAIVSAARDEGVWH